MKKTNLLRILLVVLTSHLVYGQGILTGAVLDFDASDRNLKEKAADVTILMSALLSTSEHVAMVERVALQKILEEQELGLSGTQDPNAIAQAGKLLGAHILVTGRIFEVGDTIYLTSKTISTESGRVFGHKVKIRSMNQLADGVEALAEKVDAGILEKHDVLAPATRDPEAFLNSLKKLVPEGEKPTVSVTIPEAHMSGAIPDPAVETELKKTLIELGYTVLSNEKAAQADIQIKGEAFSEFAARFGRLVACRARLEILIENPRTGTTVLAERVTVSNADVAENVAAKGALEKAGRELLPAIIPQLKQ